MINLDLPTENRLRIIGLSNFNTRRRQNIRKRVQTITPFGGHIPLAANSLTIKIVGRKRPDGSRSRASRHLITRWKLEVLFYHFSSDRGAGLNVI